MILNSWLLSHKCRQRERTSLRDGLRLPSNSALNVIRHQLLYLMKPEGSLYNCINTQVNRMSRSRRVLAIGGKHCDYGWTGSVFIHSYFL